MTAPPRFQMSREDVMNWGRNFKANGLISPFEWISVANADYKSGRLLRQWGHLDTAHVLFAQCIEKFLKTYVTLAQQNPRKLSHGILKIRNSVAILPSPTQQEIDAYEYLSDCYDFNRYPDNADAILQKRGGRFSMSGAFLDWVDEEVAMLMEKMPMLDEVKYRTNFFTDLYSFENHPAHQHRPDVLKLNNKAIAKRDAGWRAIWLEVQEHHYPGWKKRNGIL